MAVVVSEEPIISQSERHFSFKFFPAKVKAGHGKLLATARSPTGYKPDFFSCTYGAGRPIRDHMLSIMLQLDGEVKVPTAPHLSCIGDLKAELRELFSHYREADIRRIVVLYGDLPSGMGMASGESRYVNELVDFIRTEIGDHSRIKVATYPEVHPWARSFEDDLVNLVHKVKIGASNAITQYSFNTDACFYFIERVVKLSVDIPVVLGIMPITNYFKLAHSSDACGIELPRQTRKQLEAYGDDSRSIQASGEQAINEMYERLLEGGAPGLRFYILNQADPSLTIWKNLQLPR